MHFKEKAIIQRLKLQKNSVIVRTERIEKGYGGKIAWKLLKIERCQMLYLLKTSLHLGGHYLLIDNLSLH